MIETTVAAFHESSHHRIFDLAELLERQYRERGVDPIVVWKACSGALLPCSLPGPPQITCVSNKRLLPNVISGPPYACAGQGVPRADCVYNGRTNSTSRSELGWAFARTLKLGSLNALPRGAQTAAH